MLRAIDAHAKMRDASRVRNREEEGDATKSGDERRIPLRGDALTALRNEHERRDPDPSERVIVDGRGLPLKKDRVSHRFKFFVRKAKLDRREQIHFHTLRHSYATGLLEKGLSMSKVSRQLGHSSMMLTDQFYSHVKDDGVSTAIDEAFGDLE